MLRKGRISESWAGYSALDDKWKRYENVLLQLCCTNTANQARNSFLSAPNPVFQTCCSSMLAYQTYLPINLPTYLPTHIHTYTHTYIHTYTHTHTHTQTYTHIHTHTYIHTYIHTHTYTHTYIHTYIHT